MKALFSYINEHVLIKVASLKTLSITVRLLSGLLISKCIALFLGPEGMAFYGSFYDYLKGTKHLATSGFYSGAVKQIYKFKHDAVILTKTLSTVFFFGFFSTMAVAFTCYYNAAYINDILFFGNQYVYVVKAFALILPCYALNVYMLAILKGFSKHKTVLVISLLSHLVALLITILLIKEENIDGALIALVLVPVLNFLMTLVAIAFRKNLVTFLNVTQIRWSIVCRLKPYMILALLSFVGMPLVYIGIRYYIVVEVGLREAGFWTAITRFSGYYLMFFNALLTFYILPRFKEIRSKKVLKTEIYSFYKCVLPWFIMILLFIYFGRKPLVGLMFTEDFTEVEHLIAYQLFGDFARSVALVIAYKFLASKMFNHFIILEVFLLIILSLSSMFFIDIYGLKGAVIAHSFSYVLYFAIVFFMFNSSIFNVLNDKGLGVG